MTTPATAVQTVENVVSRLLALGVAKLVPMVLAECPVPLGELLGAVMSMPAVQDEIVKLEGEAAQLAGDEFTAIEKRLEVTVHAYLQGHPKLGAIYSAVTGSPILGEVLSLSAEEVKALLAAKNGGQWDKVKTLLSELGLLQAA